jgi:hypothetical protein
MNNVNSGIITDEARNNALDLATYYAAEPDIYHRIKYNFNSNLDLKLKVPDSTIKKARLTILGPDCCYCGISNIGQAYYIDGKEVASYTTDGCAGLCGFEYGTVCNINPVEITNLIPSGEHEIKADKIDSPHTMMVEALTSPYAPKKFVLYGPSYRPWINETTKSMDLHALQTLLIGEVPTSETAGINTTSTT